MWQVINRFSHNHSSTNEPDDQEFYHHFKELCIPQNADYFSEEYENMATEFLKRYDESKNSHPVNISAIEEIINDNFSVDEIECAIDSLKTNKSPGHDCIPVEFIKACKTPLSPIITTVLNYIIDHRDFPKSGRVVSGPLCTSQVNAILSISIGELQYYQLWKRSTILWYIGVLYLSMKPLNGMIGITTHVRQSLCTECLGGETTSS